MGVDMISDKRFAEIKKAVGNPFTMSPNEYMTKLKEEAGSDDILTQFWQRASKLDRESRRLSPEEWLKQLTAVDFTNLSAIAKHHFALTVDEVGKFDLGTDGEDTFAIATYPEALFTEEPLFSRLYSTGSEFGDYNPHPALLSLQKGEIPLSRPALELSTTVTLTVSGQPLPSLVLPIGQLQKRPKAKTDVSFLDTDYVLVIDAVTTRHPVWLIYDRNPRDELGERHIVNPDQQPLAFRGIGKNFDAAQVFPSVQDWVDFYGNLDFAQLQKAMQKTSITGPVKATEVAISDAAKLFRKREGSEQRDDGSGLEE